MIKITDEKTYHSAAAYAAANTAYAAANATAYAANAADAADARAKMKTRIIKYGLKLLADKEK